MRDRRGGKHGLIMGARSLGMLFSLSILGAAMLAPPLGVAQQPTVPSVLAGTWVYDGTAERALQILDAAFAPGVESLPYFFQSLARNRIHANMQPASRVTVTLTGARVRVVLASADVTKVIEGPLGGTATTSGVDESTTVTSGLRSGWLELSYEGEGDMTQLFSTEPDGTRMHLDSTVTTDRFPAPVRWRLDYVRAPVTGTSS